MSHPREGSSPVEIGPSGSPRFPLSHQKRGEGSEHIEEEMRGHEGPEVQTFSSPSSPKSTLEHGIDRWYLQVSSERTPHEKDPKRS